jgi:ubiquinone/menaquinone biosynthesis C-methylase UbiE
MASDEYAGLLEEYSAHSAEYDRKWAFYNDAVLTAALKRMRLTGDERVLDVACGTGLLAGLLREQWPDLRITGVDICESMLDVARKRLPENERVQWLHGKAEELPVEAERYDVLVCTNSFHYFRRPESAIREFHRVLKPGGTLLIVDWSRDYLACRLCELWLRFTDPAHHTMYGVENCTDLVRAGPFDVRRRGRFKINWLWGMMHIEAVKP